MNRLVQLIGLCCVALAVAVAGGGCGGDRAASGDAASGEVVVALVGGAQIGEKLLHHWMTVETAADGGSAPGEAAMRRQVLGLLISWRWTLGEAQEEGVQVSDAETRKQMGLSKADLTNGLRYEWFANEGELERYLVSPRVAESDQLWLLRLGMLAARLAQRRVKLAASAISHTQIAAYYGRHRPSFFVGERRDIRAIMNRSRARVVEAKRELQAGRSFSSVAERFNQSIEGGLRLGRARGEGTKRYEKDYFAAPPHVLVGPLKEILYYIFEVMSIRPGYQKTVAQAEPTIRQLLAQHDASTTLLQAYERKWRARTRCRVGFSAAGCGRYGGIATAG
jgi:hypothetical protein